MIRVPTRQGLYQALDGPRKAGAHIGLVPTMGFLHEGHLSLVDLAKAHAEYVAVSLFVNPLQFGPGEDLDRYPRDLNRDLALLERRGVDLAFHPEVEEMYPQGDPLVTVDPGPMGGLLCGARRPGHFRGVLTVVARLLGLFRPDLVVFGQKDFQQAVLIKRMVTDLELGVEVLLGPVVREADGLALSSRNTYLDEEERVVALGLHESLEAVGSLFAAGERSLAVLREALRDRLSGNPGLHLEYGQIVDPESLQPVDPVPPGAVAAVAAQVGGTRLIDNLILPDNGD